MTITAIGAALIFLCLWLQAEIRNWHKNAMIRDLQKWNDERHEQIMKMGGKIMLLQTMLIEEHNSQEVARQLAKHVPAATRVAAEIGHE